MKHWVLEAACQWRNIYISFHCKHLIIGVLAGDKRLTQYLDFQSQCKVYSVI